MLNIELKIDVNSQVKGIEAFLIIINQGIFIKS